MPDRDFIKTIPGRGYCFIAGVSAHGGPDVVPVTPRGESPLSIRLPAAMSDLIGEEARTTGGFDLAAALQLAERIDAGGTIEMGPGMEPRRRVPTEIAQAWITTAGQTSPREFGLHAVEAMLRLAEDEPATPSGLGAGSAPKRLFLLLSIDPVILGRQDRAVRTREALPV